MKKKWKKRFAQMAELVADWSKDPSTKVGAVIVDEDNRIVSTGFNGFPKGFPDDDELLANRDFKYDVIIHAEENAILFSNTDLQGKTIVVTHHPCPRCSSKIAQKGIKRVIITKRDKDFELRWAEKISRAKHILKKAHVKITYLEECV